MTAALPPRENRQNAQRKARKADRRRRIVRFFLGSFVAVSLGMGCGKAPSSSSVSPTPGSAEAEGSELDSAPAVLHFVDAAGKERAIGSRALSRACGEEVVEVDDPYHRKRMRYVAIGLRCVLERGFADSGGAAGQRDRGLLLRALDGYTRPVAGRELLEDGAYLAIGEPDRMQGGTTGSRFSPIDRRRVDPAPFYLVWKGVARNDPHETPWPFQLSRIEVAPFETAFPRTVPSDLPRSDPGWRGYALFQESCASCHSINGQGGKVGPDLNVPRSIVEYRPIPQIRAYIRNPEATRYTSMPAHPQLGEADLDALIDYFSAMSERKDDPRNRGDS